MQTVEKHASTDDKCEDDIVVGLGAARVELDVALDKCGCNSTRRIAMNNGEGSDTNVIETTGTDLRESILRWPCNLKYRSRSRRLSSLILCRQMSMNRTEKTRNK